MPPPLSVTNDFDVADLGLEAAASAYLAVLLLKFPSRGCDFADIIYAE